MAANYELGRTIALDFLHLSRIKDETKLEFLANLHQECIESPDRDLHTLYIGGKELTPREFSLELEQRRDNGRRIISGAFVEGVKSLYTRPNLMQRAYNSRFMHR